MTAGVIGRVPRVALIVVALGLGTATLTLAANSTTPAAPPAAAAPAAPQELVVPDVRRQAYVFAKGSLEQGGFAWRVEGDVPGYAANVVVAQSPAPGARLVADGNPIIVLRLARNGAYEQEGLPENEAPYPGKPARLVGAKPAAKPARTVAATAPKARKAAPTKAKPVAKPKPVARAKPAAKTPAPRRPAFTVPGAPAEPRDEIALTARAQRLAAWVEAHPRRTPQAVSHWLYQHNWIVTGAGFGWARGAEALRTLIEVDRRVQELWSVGARSERVARRALAHVEKRSR
jgi:PASTA domain